MGLGLTLTSVFIRQIGLAVFFGFVVAYPFWRRFARKWFLRAVFPAVLAFIALKAFERGLIAIDRIPRLYDRFNLALARPLYELARMRLGVLKIPIPRVLELLERVCELVFRANKAAKHYMTHGDINHCFTRCGIALIVLAVPPVAPQPAERALDDPALRQHHEAFDLGWPQHGLRQPTKDLFHAFGQVVPAVGAVGEDHLQSVESCLQLSENSQDEHGSIVVLDARGMDNDRQDQPERVDNNMTLASIDFLTGVVTPLAADLGRLDSLTVDDRRTGRPLAPAQRRSMSWSVS